MKNKIRNFASNPDHYRYIMYMKFNPELVPSPLLNSMHPSTKDIIRFRLGSHNLPIEKVRWGRAKTDRDKRVCVPCGVMGDERHVLYDCNLIYRVFFLLRRNCEML